MFKPAAGHMQALSQGCRKVCGGLWPFIGDNGTDISRAHYLQVYQAYLVQLQGCQIE